jgi:hypothetical protein
MRQFFLFTITALLLWGCVDLLPSKSGNSGAVVVNCVLNDSDVQELKLTRTSNVEDIDGFNVITNANAYLYELNGSDIQLAGEFEHVGNGDYSLHYRPAPGKRYKLEVSTFEGENLSGVTQMPEAVVVIPYNQARVLEDWWYGENRGDALIPDFDYYAPGIKKGTDMYILEKAPLKNVIWVSILTGKTIHEDILTSVPGNYKLSPIITASSSDYLSSFFNKLNPSDSLDQTYWLYFTMRLFEKWEIDHDWKFMFFRQLDSTVMTAFSIKTLSAEYDTYLKSVMTKAWTFQDETGLSSMFDISKVYTNITGGYGVFGAYSEELVFYNQGRFVNIYLAQTRQSILRTEITEFMKNIPWDDYELMNSLMILKNYIQWLDSEV